MTDELTSSVMIAFERPFQPGIEKIFQKNLHR